MTDRERLERSGYKFAATGTDKYCNEYALYIKKMRHHRIAIFEFDDRSTFIMLDSEEKRGDIVGSAKLAIAFGEKWLAKKAAERRAEKKEKQDVQ